MIDVNCDRYMIRWRLRQIMAEINLTNQALASLSEVHRVTISKLKNADEITQISGDVLNKLCNGLTKAYKQKGMNRLITPGDLMIFTLDEESDQTVDRSINHQKESEKK